MQTKLLNSQSEQLTINKENKFRFCSMLYTGYWFAVFFFLNIDNK